MNDCTESSAEETEAEEITKEVRIEIKDELPPQAVVYADQLWVSHSENDFVLRFCRLDRPIVRDPEEAERVETVTSNVVAKVIVSPTMMEKIVKALEQNLKRYRASYGQTAVDAILGKEKEEP